MIYTTDKFKLSKLFIIWCILVNSVSAISLTPRCSNKRDDDFRFEMLRLDDGNVIHSFADTDDALNYAEHLYLNGDDVSKYRAFCNDTRMSLEGFDISREGKAKRWKCSNAPLGTHFTQRRTVENGTFFSKWSQVACEFNNSIQEVPHRALPKPWKYTKSKRADRGFNHKSCKRLAKSFGLDAVDKVKFNNDKEGVSCASKLNEFASASIRVPMFYSKQQTQRCVRKYYGKHGCKCGHWSKIKYGEFPIKNKRPEYLCSSQKNSCK